MLRRSAEQIIIRGIVTLRLPEQAVDSYNERKLKVESANEWITEVLCILKCDLLNLYTVQIMIVFKQFCEQPDYKSKKFL